MPPTEEVISILEGSSGVAARESSGTILHHVSIRTQIDLPFAIPSHEPTRCREETEHANVRGSGVTKGPKSSRNEETEGV